VNDDVHLATILRRCKILAARLGHEPFKEWVGNELNGYSNSVPLPTYRASRQARIKGNLSGSGQAQASAIDVPFGALPQEAREWATEVSYRQSVAELEDLARGESHLARPLPADLAARTTVYRGWTTLELWQDISRSEIVGVLDQIRNKVLTFVLEIESENPEAGEAAAGSEPVPRDKVNQIFNTYVFGGAAAIGDRVTQDVSQTVEVRAGDVASLETYLRTLGLGGDLAALHEALAGDGEIDATRRELGPRTRSWIGRAASKAGVVAGDVGANAGGALLGAAIIRFLGW
jgi:hypothetical protein